MSVRSVMVLRGGALTTVQDEGRPGLAHLAVPRSGSLDRPAHHLANRLVGNPQPAPVLETTLDGVTLLARQPLQAAVTGALCDVTVDGRAVGWSVPVHVRAGQTLDVGRARRGVRSYVALSGAPAVETVLGSASADLLSGLGPTPLATGDLLLLGEPTGAPASIDLAPYPLAEAVARLTADPGPRADRMTTSGRTALASESWTVSADSNRIGLRLDGPAVTDERDEELPSEGLVLGAVQSPPGGGLIVFLADHPTTGGYPVVAVVAPESLAACAQAAPGSRVRFTLRG